jgi:hypothetical protein
VGGLPWLNPTDVRGVKPEGGKIKNLNKKNLFLFFNIFFLLGAGGPPALREVACDKK